MLHILRLEVRSRLKIYYVNKNDCTDRKNKQVQHQSAQTSFILSLHIARDYKVTVSSFRFILYGS